MPYCLDIKGEIGKDKNGEVYNANGFFFLFYMEKAIQRALERWASANLMDFKKAKYEVLHMDWGNLKKKYKLDGEQP